MNWRNKIIIGCTFLTFSFLFSFSQEKQSNNKAFENISARIEKNLIPKIITDAYFKEYKTITEESWYGYPFLINEENWFDCNPTLYSKVNPKYYVVEFVTNNGDHIRIVYDSIGKKITTYKSIDTKIQKAIAKSIFESKYKDWKILREKEEIFRDLDFDKLVVYKIEVQNLNSKHFLFYNASGILLKDKVIEP